MPFEYRLGLGRGKVLVEGASHGISFGAFEQHKWIANGLRKLLIELAGHAHLRIALGIAGVDDARLGGAGGDELQGLPHVGCGGDARLQGLPQPELFQRLPFAGQIERLDLGDVARRLALGREPAIHRLIDCTARIEIRALQSAGYQRASRR